MLSQADAELVARDPALPGLASLLDPTALASSISAALREPVGDVDIRYLRYKPGMNCIAAFSIEGDGIVDGPCYAKAYGRDALHKLDKAHERSTGRAHNLPPLIFAENGMAVFRFPTDAKLGALSRLGGDDALRGLVERVFRWAELPPIRFETLAYKPERRYVGRFTGPEGVPAVLRFYQRADFPAARCSSTGFSSREVLRVAKRIGGSKRHAVLALEWLPGKNLREILRGEDWELAVPRVARALAELHMQAAADLRPGKDDSGARRAALCETVGFLVPGLRANALRVAARVAESVAAEEARDVPIHGDLYDKQILVDLDRVGIVDFDNATRGDCRRDLGLMIAHLERDAVQGEIPVRRVEAIEAALLDAYQGARGRRVGPLGPFVAEGLLELAHHPFRARVPGWPTRIERILERAEARVGSRKP